MNKATKAIKRSSVRLKSFTSGHGELNLIISDVREVRSAAKAFADAQETLWKDLSKWTSKEKNQAITESFSYFLELNRMWTEVQSDFFEQLTRLRHSFEMILEGETSVDKLRDHLSICESRLNKLNKELQKAIKKNDDIREIEERIGQTRSSIKTTQTEITERTHENEAVKVVRLKEGLLKLSDSYLDMAHKSSFIFDGQKQICASLPELEQPHGMANARYRGADAGKQTLGQVKQLLKTYKRPSEWQPGAPPPYSSPPPGTTPTSPPPNYYPRFNQYDFPVGPGFAGPGAYGMPM